MGVVWGEGEVVLEVGLWHSGILGGSSTGWAGWHGALVPSRVRAMVVWAMSPSAP